MPRYAVYDHIQERADDQPDDTGRGGHGGKKFHWVLRISAQLSPVTVDKH
jgi:hypothetical protein